MDEKIKNICTIISEQGKKIRLVTKEGTKCIIGYSSSEMKDIMPLYEKLEELESEMTKVINEMQKQRKD